MRWLLPWWLALTLFAAGVAVAAYQLPWIDFNNSPETYFPPNAPSQILNRELRETFPGDELVIALFKGEQIFSPDFIKRLDGVQKKISALPKIGRVFMVTTVDHIGSSEDGFSVAPVIDRKQLKKMTEAEIRQATLADRFVPGLLAARDGSALALVVRPEQMSDSRTREEIEEHLRAELDAAGLTKDLVGLAGNLPVDVAELRSMLRDSAIFIPLTASIGLTLLWWVVGRVLPVLIGAIAMGGVIVGTVAFQIAFKQPYTLVSAMIPPLLGSYTLATLLHMYSSVQRADMAGLRGIDRVERAVGQIIKPSLFNVLSTSAGLASLAWNDIPPLRTFGLVSAFGTLLLFFVVYFLVPPVLAHFDYGGWPTRGSGLAWTRVIAFRMAKFSMRYAIWVLLLTIALMVVTFPYFTKIIVESDLLKFFPEKHPITLSTAEVEKKLGGVTSIEVIFTTDGRDKLKDLTRLEAVRHIQRWLDAQPEVDRTLSVVDLLEEMNWAFHEENPAYRKLPANTKLLNQYLLIYDGADLKELVDEEFRRGRILVNMNVHGSRHIGAVIDKIRKHLDENPVYGVNWEIGGFGRMFSDQASLLVDGQLKSFWSAFGQIFLLMLFLWRSLVASTICMIPNLAPLYFVFVAMGATGITLDLATVLIAGVVLGITVDDTIHLYHGYAHRLNAGMKPPMAIARSFEASGRAVIAISILLIGQFAVLTTSSFVPTVNFGMLTAIGLFSGQILELLLLPGLLILRDRYRRSRDIRKIKRRVKEIKEQTKPWEVRKRR